MDIQWYPGHMARAERLMREEAKKADVVFLVGDARAVRQSINEKLGTAFAGKKTAYIYNKSGLCDEKMLRQWKEHFAHADAPVFFTDCLQKKGFAEIAAYMRGLRADLRYTRELRAVIAGIPNVGKSMLINALTHKASAKTGNTPGVTRGINWIGSAGDFYMLDTPGVLPVKFADREDGMVLASLGCVKDTIFDREELALWQLGFLSRRYPQLLSARYLTEAEELSPEEIFAAIARRRGFLRKGGEYDSERCAAVILEEVRNGIVGRISFDNEVTADD